VTVSATLLEAARWRWIPLAVIYLVVVAVVIAKYARPFLEQRAGDVRARESGAVGDLFLLAVGVVIGSAILAVAVTFVLYAVLWVLDKVGI
jgi:hypothetical protein